jgi:hypothetical protein
MVGVEMAVLERTQRRLELSLSRVCGHLNVLHAEMVALMREALETGAWQGLGITSPGQWLAWQTGLSLERAREIVKIARRQVELPVTIAAFEAGLLAVDQVAVIARRVPAHNDAEAAGLARSASVAQLRVAFSNRSVQQPKPDPAAPAPAPGAGAGAGGGAFLVGVLR